MANCKISNVEDGLLMKRSSHLFYILGIFSQRPARETEGREVGDGVERKTTLSAALQLFQSYRASRGQYVQPLCRGAVTSLANEIAFAVESKKNLP